MLFNYFLSIVKHSLVSAQTCKTKKVIYDNILYVTSELLKLILLG